MMNLFRSALAAATMVMAGACATPPTPLPDAMSVDAPADAIESDVSDATQGDAARADIADDHVSVPDANGFMSLEPCLAPMDFVESGSEITFSFFDYTPTCLRVRVGTMVTWRGDLAVHPLRPSTRGSASNPIPSASAGTSATATFTTAGFFPYFCIAHGSDNGTGMTGVVQVVP